MIGRSRPMRPRPLRASGDRWLFGYADVLTLLFACFVGLYATAQEPAATPASVTPPVVVAVAEIPAVPEAPEVPEAFTRLAEVTDGLPALELAADTRGLVMSLPEVGTFAPGRTELSAGAEAVLSRIADQLRDLPNEIRVEGHTDDVPIRTSVFASNWELSTLRATMVVRFLIAKGLSPERLSALGYADTRPRAAAGTAEGRARNRRVDIIVPDRLVPRADQAPEAR